MVILPSDHSVPTLTTVDHSQGTRSVPGLRQVCFLSPPAEPACDSHRTGLSTRSCCCLVRVWVGGQGDGILLLRCVDMPLVRSSFAHPSGGIRPRCKRHVKPV